MKKTIELSKNNSLAISTLLVSLITLWFLANSIISSTMNYDSSKVHSLSYYTIQSNIIVFIWLLALAIYFFSNNSFFKKATNINISATITTYILVTGIIYWLVLVPIYFEPGESSWLFTFSNIWLHTITPIYSLFILLLIRYNNKEVKAKLNLLTFFIYPIMYIIYAMINAINEVYFYPMFNPKLLGSWFGVAICIIVIAAIFTALYSILLLGLKKKNK